MTVISALSYQEQQAIIAAVEDAVIQSLPARLPMTARIALTLQVRQAVARALKSDTEQAA